MLLILNYREMSANLDVDDYKTLFPFFSFLYIYIMYTFAFSKYVFCFSLHRKTGGKITMGNSRRK